MVYIVVIISYFALINNFALANCDLELNSQIIKEIGENKFILKRLTNNPHTKKPRYKIEIPVEFRPHPKLPVPKNYKGKMSAIANRCLQAASSAFRGPSGEEIEISLKQNSKLSPNEIYVFSGYAWVPHKQWSVDYNCPTIIHEIMHFIGLPDEYPLPTGPYEITPEGKWVRWLTENEAKELDPPKVKRLPRYCRPEGPIDSILFDQYSAYRAANIPLTKKDLLWVYQYECQRQKPDQKAQDKYKRCVSWKDQINPKHITDDQVKNFNSSIDDIKIYKRDSIFYPGESSALLFDPNCNANSKLFQTCIANSNRTENEGCLPMPKSCSDGSFDWLKGKKINIGSVQEEIGSDSSGSDPSKFNSAK